MKYLFVGLGNPGSKYEETRHNIGFKVLEALAKELGGTFTLQKTAEVAEVKFKGRTLILVKPTTYMNLSGKAVNYYLQQEKILKENMVVVTDDLALPFGKLRMKGKGSDGGHNGLKDIQATLNSVEYCRLRFGVGSDFHKGQQVDYVLGEWSAEERETLNERINIATEFLKGFATIGIQLTMTNWNGK
ncbi:aminoacyl-tRNA hydrolase [Fluviicola taffensis]|uniref:Peptidyl-tRNA hydrolase n=1 Tax=Fluviicola taffensis (strain DSM 16823 / NCIMB 13979 / RW262) TaxID=755732 RepID=F2IHE6_FLUTR|nr:aminoacyl-tRNA hydrolase [Fluviicola taffensis]AEA43711.1 peptidyl-tRNA hydrolase [Fluviicola taffensis DSM 16823]